jgi:hypothetical protein
MTITIDRHKVEITIKDQVSASYLTYMNMLKDLSPQKAIYLFDGSETIFNVLNDLGYIDTLFSTSSVTVRYVPKRSVLVQKLNYFDGSESDEEKLAENIRIDLEYAKTLDYTGWNLKIEDMLKDIVKNTSSTNMQRVVTKTASEFDYSVYISA